MFTNDLESFLFTSLNMLTTKPFPTVRFTRSCTLVSLDFSMFLASDTWQRRANCSISCETGEKWPFSFDAWAGFDSSTYWTSDDWKQSQFHRSPTSRSYSVDNTLSWDGESTPGVGAWSRVSEISILSLFEVYLCVTENHFHLRYNFTQADIFLKKWSYPTLLLTYIYRY